MFEKFSIINSLTVLNSVVDGLFEEAGVKAAKQRSKWIHRKLLVELERVNRIKHISVRLARLAVLEISDSQPEEFVVCLEELERREELERSKEMEHMQVLERIEEQQQRKVFEQREEREHSLNCLNGLNGLHSLKGLDRVDNLKRLRNFKSLYLQDI